MNEETKTAKVPEGVTVDTPRKQPMKRLDIPNLTLDPTLPSIVNPHFTNNAKTEMACVLLRPDGMATQEKNIPTDEKHPVYRDIRRQFSDEEIEHNTRRQVSINNALADSAKEQKAIKDREKSRAKLWEIKSTFMDLPAVKSSEEKILKRKLRSALTPEEAQAYGIAILIKEAEKEDGN